MGRGNWERAEGRLGHRQQTNTHTHTHTHIHTHTHTRIIAIGLNLHCKTGPLLDHLRKHLIDFPKGQDALFKEKRNKQTNKEKQNLSENSPQLLRQVHAHVHAHAYTHARHTHAKSPVRAFISKVVTNNVQPVINVQPRFHSLEQ